MNQLMTSSQPLTMTTIDFLENMINPARAEEGQPSIRYNDFLTKVKDEIEPTHDEFFAMESTGGRSRQVMNLDHDQMMLVGMRESKAVRKNVLTKIKQLISNEPQQPQIPTNFAEALQLAADQAKQLELAAPKVAFVDNLVNRDNLLTATQVGQKHKLSAIKLNRILSELDVYNRAVKRGKVFKQWFIDKGFGENKKTELGFDQPLFTNAGEIWINEKLHAEGIV